MGALFFAGCLSIALYGRQSFQYTIDQTIDQPITARVGFKRVDGDQTQRAREAAKEATPSVYRFDGEPPARVAGELRDLYQAAKAAESFEALKPAAEPKWILSEDAFEALRGLSDAAGGARFEEMIAELEQGLREEYTVRSPEEERRGRATSMFVRVLYPSIEPEVGPPALESLPPIEVPRVNLIPITNRKILEGRAAILARAFPASLRSTVSAVLLKHLSQAPILEYDAEQTKVAMEAASSEVPEVIVEYAAGVPLISPPPGGDRVVLNKNDVELLRLESEAYLRVLGNDADPEGHKLRLDRWRTQLGTAALFAMFSFGLFAYIHQYHPRIVRVRSRTVAFVLLTLGVIAASKFIDVRLPYRELTIGPLLVAAAILTIAYPARFAAGTGVITAFIVVVTVQGDMGMFVLLVAGITAVTLTLVEIRTRTRIIMSGLFTALVVAAVCQAFGLIEGQQTEYFLKQAAVASATALVAALVIHAFLPFIERAFKIATPLTLQEWGDATKPLLQRLAHGAPGTYNHSLVLGALAQSCCEAIEANGLLARVGALYHDIGKIHKAEYFVENQEASINRHDHLSPSMSLLIIVGHVKDGIEMAREYGLPRVLRQFIEEHHGTTVVRYFKHVAIEKQKLLASGKHDRELSDAEFRYPGPKPRSKESAILMLCDGVEGAVRALAEPTPGRIESIVHSVLSDRLSDGQFDDCEITLRELHRVEEALVKGLCRFYHGRVAYPKSPKEESVEAADEPARSVG